MLVPPLVSENKSEAQQRNGQVWQKDVVTQPSLSRTACAESQTPLPAAPPKYTGGNWPHLHGRKRHAHGKVEEPADSNADRHSRYTALGWE